MAGLLDALDYAGSVAEKFGGREVRGLLGGKPRELLSAIPFSDTLGITNPEDRVTGHDLASQWGLTSPEHPWASTAAGFGVDLATDPLNWLAGAGLARHGLKGGSLLAGLKNPAVLAGTGLGAGLGGYEGYQRDGAGGALAGALQGGMAGGMVGGGLHRAATSPAGKAFMADELGALLLPERLDPLMPRRHDLLRAAEGDTPLNKLVRLADAVGIDVGAEPHAAFLHDPESYGAAAWYTPPHGVITPNLINPKYQQEWFSNPAMAAAAERTGAPRYREQATGITIPEFSTQSPYHYGLHEIGHGLHHRALGYPSTPEGYLNPQLREFGRLQSSRHTNPYDIWEQELQNRGRREVSMYGSTSPAELTTEMFVPRVLGRTEWSPELNQFYKSIKGPEPPGSLLGELGDIMRGRHREAPISPWSLDEYYRALDKYYGIGQQPMRTTMQPALGLKYDPRVSSKGELFNPSPGEVGLARHDPEWANQRTFYHGTGTPGLTAETLDPRKTAPGNLYRQGVYTTEEAGRLDTPVTQGYAEARASEALEKELDRYASTANIAKAIQEGRLNRDDLASVLRTGMGAPTEEQISRLTAAGADPRVLASWARRHIQNMAYGAARHPEMYTPEAAPESFLRILQGLGPVPEEHKLIYQGQSNFGKILDLDVHDPGLQRELYDALQGRGVGGSVSRPQDYMSLGNLYQSAVPVGETSSIAGIKALKDMGYDALTHYGGGRTYGSPHQVVIGLDPNDVLGLGRATPYQQWELYKRLTGGS